MKNLPAATAPTLTGAVAPLLTTFQAGQDYPVLQIKSIQIQPLPDSLSGVVGADTADHSPIVLDAPQTTSLTVTGTIKWPGVPKFVVGTIAELFSITYQFGKDCAVEDYGRTITGDSWDFTIAIKNCPIAVLRKNVSPEYYVNYSFRFTLDFAQYNFSVAAAYTTPALDVDHIEVVQVVQNATNDAVPLVAGKGTVVRVFPKVTGSNSFMEGVTGTLTATKNGQPVRSYPTLSPFNGPIIALPNPARDNEFASLDFLLPPAWTTEGETQFTVELSEPTGLKARAQLPDAAHPTLIRFRKPPDSWPETLYVGVLRVCPQAPGEDPRCPSDSTRFRTEFLDKLFPLRDGGVWFYPLSLPPLNWTPIKTSDDLQELKAGLRLLYNLIDPTVEDGVPRLDQLIAFLPRIPDGPPAGTSDPIWMGGSGRVTIVQDTQDSAGKAGAQDFLTTSHAVAHELAHNFGLQHPLAAGPNGIPQLVAGSCGAEGAVPDWPYTDATIHEVGYDVEKKRVVPASKKDLMTYCSPPGDSIWISPFNFNNLFNRNGMTSITFNLPLTGTVVVSGVIEASGAAATVRPAYAGMFRALDASNPEGEFCVELQGAAGVLGANCFNLSFKDHATGAPLARASFSRIMPDVPGIRRIVILRRATSTVLGALEAGLQRPSISIMSPLPGTRLTPGPVTISWSAFDPDGDPLWFLVRYRSGGGWLPLAWDLTGNSYTVDTSKLAGGSRVEFQVIATDGIHRESATTDPFEVVQNPALAISPDKIAFGDVVIGQQAQASLTVTNTGDGVLRISSAASDSPLFTAALAAALAIEPGATAPLVVQFRPEEHGSQTATLTLVSNDAKNLSVTVPLTGRGVATAAPLLQVSPTALEFGPVTLGQQADRMLSVLNLGAGKLNATSATSSDPRFTVVMPTGPFGVNAHAALDITVRFAPTASGPAAGTLTIASNDPSQPTLKVPLSGTGLGPPTIDASPATLAFGNVVVSQSKDLTLTLRNTGGATLNVTRATSSQPVFTAPSFAPLSIEPGAQAGVNIRFTPAGSGAVSGSLNLATNDPSRPTLTVALSGTGTTSASAPSMSVAPASLDFGQLAAGQSKDLTLTLSNTGGTAATAQTVTFTSTSFSLVSPATPFSIPAGGKATITIRFTPTASGVLTGMLRCTFSDASLPAIEVSLRGEGLAASGGASIEASPERVDFGSVSIGQYKDATITISGAKGTTALTITGVTSDNSAVKLQSPQLPITAGIGGQIALIVRYSPVAEGAFGANLTIASNAANAPRLVIPLAGTGAKAGQQRAELKVDDGSFEWAAGLSPIGRYGYFVNRLTPPAYPATLQTVRIYFDRTMPVDTPINVLYGTTTQSGAQITLSASQLRTSPAFATATGQFVDYAVPALTITSGDFVVGFAAINEDRVFPMAHDTSSASAKRSYISVSGTDFTLIDGFDAPRYVGNFGLRAVVATGNP